MVRMSCTAGRRRRITGSSVSRHAARNGQGGVLGAAGLNGTLETGGTLNAKLFHAIPFGLGVEMAPLALDFANRSNEIWL